MRKSKILLPLLFVATICLFVSCKNEPEVKKYNVSFYDGNSVLFHQTVESGKRVARPTEPTKAGYTFDNWYQDTSLAQVYDFNSPVNSDKVLYAKWNAIPTPVAEKYSVTYNGNGAISGTAPVDSNSPYTSGSTVTVLGKGDLVCDLKSFAGWNTASDGTGTSYVAGQTFEITCNTVLYAKWSNKAPSPSAPVIPSTSIRCATSETSNDASISDVDETMEYSTDGGTTWIPVTGTTIDNLGAGIVKVRVKETDTALAGEITDVDLRCENTSVPSGLAYVAPTTIGGNDGKITGVSTAMEYSTDGGEHWNPCGTEITGLSAGDVLIRYSGTDKKKASTPTTITVENKVTITFDGNGGTGSMTSVLIQKGTSYTLPESTFTAPTAKSFSKWKVDGSTTEYSVGDSFIVSSNITLVAQWNYAYLCFTANQSNSSVALNKSGSVAIPDLETSVDGGATWQSYIAGTTGNIVLQNVGDSVYFRRSSDILATQFSEGVIDYLSFVMTGSVSASGNVMSLIDKTCQDTKIPDENCFCYLFRNCTSLITSPDLPAEELSNFCYYGMFYGCRNLTTATSILPALSLADYCYTSMFEGCRSLVMAPTLPAMNLSRYCYDHMFCDCVGLTSAPVLPAMTLTQSCYESMFSGCTHLSVAPDLPATALNLNCYYKMYYGCESLTTVPDLLPAEILERSCYKYMFYGCKDLTKAPILPALDLAESCYSAMFMDCTSLITAPALPATNLAENCYECMFSGCTSLTTVPSVLPAMSLKKECYSAMFSDCALMTTAPALPATLLANSCYYMMFRDCTALASVPALPATSLAERCYQYMFKGCDLLCFSETLSDTCCNEYRVPFAGTGVVANYWNIGMFNETGGTFTSDPYVNTTYYTNATVI